MGNLPSVCCLLHVRFTHDASRAACRTCPCGLTGGVPVRRDHDSSVFETTIRVVGGLLAAHDLSGDAMFARRCARLASMSSAVASLLPHCWLNGSCREGSCSGCRQWRCIKSHAR